MITKPTIYVFTTAYDPFIGGAEIAVAETVKRLSVSFEFVVFTARFRRELRSLEKGIGGETIVRIGWGNALDKFLLPILGPWMVWRSTKHHAPALYWAIMISYASGIPYILNIFSRRKIPILLTLQEGDPESYLRRGRGGIIGLAWRLALRRASRITAISRYLVGVAERFGNRGRAEVIHNGVDVTKFKVLLTDREKADLKLKLGLGEDSKIIITTSRLVPKNGLDTLISALPAVRKIQTNAHILIIGSGPEERSLRRLARSLQVAKEVIFLGEIPHHELPRYLAIADVFARPSRSEGMGNSFVEALAAGLPIIGTPVGGILDIIQARITGLFVNVDDVSDCAEKITLLLRDRELASSIAAKGNALIRERFSWDSIAKQYESFFLETMAPRMKILIATGIFPPEIGGSGQHAERLFQILGLRGYEPEVVAYGERSSKSVVRLTRRLPTGLRHFAAFLRLWPLVRRADIAILMDHFSMGVPAALASLVAGRPYVVRVGGDFLWEMYVKTKRNEITLPDFYRQPPPLSLKHKIIWKSARWVLKRADTVIFSTGWQREIFKRAYDLAPSRLKVIENPWDGAETPHLNLEANPRTILYAGRFLFIKNFQRTLEAFCQFTKDRNEQFTLSFIGEGSEETVIRKTAEELGISKFVTLEPALSHVLLQSRLARARAVIVPSLSDVSPNLVLEALALGVPVILTKHNGLGLREKHGVLLVDPMSVSSIKTALDLIADPLGYGRLRKAAGGLVIRWSWQNAADAYEAVLGTIKKHGSPYHRV